MRAGVDFYYLNGFLINFYSHGMAIGDGGSKPYPATAGHLVTDYIQYCADAQRFPRLWANANARAICDWWMKRAAAHIAVTCFTNGGHVFADTSIQGSGDPDAAIELLDPGAGSMTIFHVLMDGAEASTNHYRTQGNLTKVHVGNLVNSVRIEYVPNPRPPPPAVPQDDTYAVQEGVLLTIPAPGLLANDQNTNWPSLTVANLSTPRLGSVTNSGDGGFTYIAYTNGTDCFTYELISGTNRFGPATVTISVIKTNCLFSDDFRRCASTTLPWQVHSGDWAIGDGTARASTPGLSQYAYCYFDTNWANYSVEANFQFPAGSFGGGLGGRLNPATGGHYSAWVYPSLGVIRLVKFWTWESWGLNGVPQVPMAEASVAIDAGWHPLRLIVTNNQIEVWYQGDNVISTNDIEASPHMNGGVSLDMWTGGSFYTMSVSNLISK